MVLLEAMAAGCAVITTSIGGCTEVVGDSAIRVKPGDASEIRVALKKLTNDDEHIQHYGQLAQERVKQFSTERVVKMYLELFNRVIKQ